MSEMKAISEERLVHWQQTLEQVRNQLNTTCQPISAKVINDVSFQLIESYREAISLVKILKDQLFYVTYQLKEHGNVGPCTNAGSEKGIKQATDFLGGAP